LAVRFRVEGTAGNGADYATLTPPVTIPANAATGTITVNVVNDALGEADEIINLVLEPAPEYVVGTPGTATMTIVDNDTPSITSLNPSAVSAGGQSFTLAVLGTNFGSGAIVDWNQAPLSTVFVSSSELRASVPADRIAAPGTASITVRSAGTTSNAQIFTISAPPEIPEIPVIQSISPDVVSAGGPAFTLVVQGSGFAGGATVSFGGSTLAATIINAAQLSAAVPASLIVSPRTVSITVLSRGQTSNAVNLTVQAFTIAVTGPPAPAVPTQNANVAVQLGTPALTPLDGALTISFNPAAGLPAGIRDPALQFTAGGTTLNFTVPAQAATASLAQNGAIQQGTIAGDIVVSITRLTAGGVSVLPQPAPNRVITVPRLAPVIVPATVRIVMVTANSFDVDLTAYSTTRELTGASFTFTTAAGTAIDGAAAFSLDLRSAAAQWYGSPESLAFGSLVRMRVRFNIEGNSNSLQNVTVTLTNSVGDSATDRWGR
jgi:hypothetical protein